MKTILAGALFAAVSMHPLFADEDFILQEAVIDGNTVTYKIPVSGDEGEVVSQPVDADSSIFRLITVYTDGDGQVQTLQLDTKTVGTFVPSASITLSSKDPYGTPRTRFDQPYGVKVTVSNLSTNAADPIEAREVKVYRSYKLYDPTTFAAYPDDAGKTYSESFTFTADGSYNLSDGTEGGGMSPRLDALENPDSYMMGEETYTVVASGTDKVLASATMIIWPLATAEIIGVDQTQTYTQVPTETSVKYHNLYPGSQAYVQVRIGDEDKIINASALSYSSAVKEPQTQQLPLTELDQLVTEDGVYILKAFTITPFNDGAPEQLSIVDLTVKNADGTEDPANPTEDPEEEVPVTIKRTIKVNGGLSTME